MKIWMIRHGLTKGNIEKRYVGTTDESLHSDGFTQLEKLKSKVSLPDEIPVFMSPLKRCIETADYLFAAHPKTIISQFRECDFGDFEYHNYIELNGREDYQYWIDHGGMTPFPGGEALEDYKKRTLEGFERMLDLCKEMYEIDACIMIVHGGTIMAICDAYVKPHQDYFKWQVKNGQGYVLNWQSETWYDGEHVLELMNKIEEGEA